MAYLVCGLLLEGYIENTVAADRYPDGEESASYYAYMEQRTHDAITFYTQASSDKALKKVTDILLWQHQISNCPSIYHRLNQYNLILSKDVVPSYEKFERDCVVLDFSHFQVKGCQR